MEQKGRESLRTLPGDDVRQIMWRYADRYEYQMLVAATRAVARGPVARLVAEGGRNTHEWTDKKNALLKVYVEAGITTAFLDPKHGGYIEGSKNFVLALIAWELAWVDAGASTASLCNNLGLEPIHERGTEAQKDEYMPQAAPSRPGGPRRFAFALTEPIPYVGVETGMLCGKVRVTEWKDGKEPLLQVEKRGRFITNSDYMNVMVAAVETDDPRIKTSCMIILDEKDPGSFDRGSVTRKLVHQLSSTRDPVVSVKVPAGRIVGGYAVDNGVIVPKYSHEEVIAAVFRRTRVTVGLMTSAKLLSAIEPVVRYHRTRFRGAAGITEGTPRYELGIQAKEDPLHRLVDVWSAGEGMASLGFEAARLFDDLTPLERAKDAIFERDGVKGRAQLKAFKKVQPEALELVEMEAKPEGERDAKRLAALKSNELANFLAADALANVLCPATKLWNTGVGTNLMRECVAMMGGYGITEDCPGWLFNKWTDGQLEATYEGPEAVQRRQLSVTMTDEVFLAHVKAFQARLRRAVPGTGAARLIEAFDLWVWTLNHLQGAADANGQKLYTNARHGVSYPMADALCWLLGAYHLIRDVEELREKGPAAGAAADGLPGLLNFLGDLCENLTARAASEVAKTAAELVHGYAAPGTESAGAVEFARRRAALDRSQAGARLARDRAAADIAQVMIPEALDYPV